MNNKKIKKKSKIILLTIYSILFLLMGILSKDIQNGQVYEVFETVFESILNEYASVDEDILSASTPSHENIKDESNYKENPKETDLLPSSKEDIFEGYTLIEVPGGDLSGTRKSKVVVDIGYGDRKYYAFTNEFGQLIKVVADEIVLQDESIEQVTAEGRYYSDEAKVPGTESAFLDEGHVIADSLGGVANAYNITPQESTLNRYGDQAYMERFIRDAGGCTDFVAIITYSNTYTQIPNHYSFTYNLKGNIIHDEFDNINPDEANLNMEEGQAK